MQQSSVPAAGQSSSVTWECDRLAHRFGSAADNGLRQPRYHPHAPVPDPCPEASLSEEKTAVPFINTADSRCGRCRLPTKPQAIHHTDVSGYSPHPGGGCGARFTRTSSDHQAVTADRLRNMRPDRPVHGEDAPPTG